MLAIAQAARHLHLPAGRQVVVVVEELVEWLESRAWAAPGAAEETA